ncbi:MAG: ATP-binding protein [Thermodesulfobacteriota bacterium]
MVAHPDPPDSYDLLKSLIVLSASPNPIEAKLSGMLQIASEGFGATRCLLLKPGEINKNGFLSRIISEKGPLWVEQGSSFDKKDVLSEEEDLLSPSFVCIPLFIETSFQGILYMGFSRERKFSGKETDLILLVAKEMEEVIRKAETSRVAQKHEKRVEQLSTLWELNKALLTSVNFERIVNTTLSAITLGDGLGFNRAMLFMVNEKDHVLEGTLAVGPASAEEAGKIWPSFTHKKGPLSDFISQLPSQGDSLLNSIVKGLRIPLEQEQCILSRTVLEARSFNTQLPQSEEGWLQTRCERGCHLGSEVGCYVSEHLSRDPRIYSFATMPLWGKGKVIGVILVDNLYNRDPITEEDIQYLSMFTHQAGLAIENVLLYRNLGEVHQELKETQNLLVHREKMAALGELCNSVAHEIKNPLVAIGGFARRLHRAIQNDSSEKRYAQSIMVEVERLEKILSDLYNYTRNGARVYQECDLKNILEDSLSMVSEKFDHGGIVISKEFSEALPKINGDSPQLKQAFFHLISNACQAMNHEGMLSLRIHPVSKNGSSFIRVEVEDTGKGIDPENLHNIFNPFYSTKDGRLGLGLPIVHKTIISHQGLIEVDNRPGEGVTFIVTLPARALASLSGERG